MNTSSSKLILSLMASSLLLSGCVGAAVGAGAMIGIGAAKEGGLQHSVTDESIRIKISDLWFRKNVDMFRKLNLSVDQGRVLVTGVVEKPEDRVEAIRLAWQPKGVKQVINEIRVGNSDTLGSYAKDTWIAGQLRTRLTFEKDVQSINYSIEVVMGTVYLMGVAQSQPELDRVIMIARHISGVKEVVSYVKMVGVDAEVGASQISDGSSSAAPIVSVGPVSSQPVSEQPVSADTSGQPTQLTADDMTSAPIGGEAAQVSGHTGSATSIQSEVLPP
jgi:osmotically-inducible protein OsmY